jgi:hypothetical protein
MSMAPVAMKAQAAMLPLILPQEPPGGSKRRSYWSCTSPP